MKEWCLLVAVILSASATASAQVQEVPKFEVFGANSYRRGLWGTPYGEARIWSISLTRNFNKHVGFTAEAGGEFESQSASPCLLLPGIRIHSPRDCATNENPGSNHFLFGPAFRRQYGAVSMTAQQLFGPANSHPEGSPATTRFAWGTGTVIEAKFGGNFAVRLQRLDSNPIYTPSGRRSEVIVQTGFSFKLGRL